MRAKVSSIFCDSDSGCGNWTVDHYEECVDRIGGVKITREKPSPGWTVSDSGEDFCPEHSTAPGQEAEHG